MDKERREREKKMYESKGWHWESHDRLRGDLRATKRHIKELNKELHPIVASWCVFVFSRLMRLRRELIAISSGYVATG